MAVKRLQLENETDQNYIIIGISCHLKDYRLVYEINKEFNLDFKKLEDLIIYPVKGKKQNKYSCYAAIGEFVEYNIISNRNPDGVLMPEYKHIDYIFILRGQTNVEQKKSLINSIIEIPRVLTAYEIKAENIKNIDIILSDLELHMLKSGKGKF